LQEKSFSDGSQSSDSSESCSECESSSDFLEYYSQDQELALPDKIFEKGLEAKQPLTLEEYPTILVENRLIEEGLGESSVAKRGTGSSKSADKSTESNLLRNQQFNSNLRVPSAKLRTIFLNVRKERLD
jgi:hypothetical protein